MYYSTIGVLAVLVLLIENQDILLMRGKGFDTPTWHAYRRFLYAVLVYYVTDILWGILESQKLSGLLFLDTSMYFIAMAVGTLFWTQYTVSYLDEKNGFGRFLIYAGRALCIAIIATTAANCFVPILFTVDEQCVYQAGVARYGALSAQIVVLLLLSAHTLTAIRRVDDAKKKRYRTISLFGLIMAIFLLAQLWFPYLPLYAVAYMLGISLLRAFVIRDEREEYKMGMVAAEDKAREAATIAELRQSISSLFNKSIIHAHIAQALSYGYENLYYVNIETDEFIEYHTDDEHSGLREVRRGADFFEQCEADANRYVHPDDRAAFVSAMRRQELLSALDADNSFVLIYRLQHDDEWKFVSLRASRMKDDERFIVIGVSDIDEQMEQRRAAERAAEESATYARINALTGDFICVYSVDPETEHFLRYNLDPSLEGYGLAKAGDKFFTTAEREGRKVVYPDDLNRYLTLFNKASIMSEIEQNGIFALRYRIVIDGAPVHVQLRAALVEEKGGPHLIVGLNNVDSVVRQEEEYAKKLSQARSLANLDALTGVKNRHAYLTAEEQLDNQISEGCNPAFAIIIVDVNDLKTVNDTEGHQSGDQYIRDACKIVCDIFKHSPVFRVGGDEFAVIAQGGDYDRVDELIAEMNEHNALAARTDGIVLACGMAKYENETSVAPVFERADLDMYKNKSQLKSAV